MTTLRKRKKQVAVHIESQEEHPRENLFRDTNALRLKNAYSKKYKKNEVKMTTQTSEESSGTHSRRLGAKTKFDEFVLNPKVWVETVIVQETSQNSNKENHERNMIGAILMLMWTQQWLSPLAKGSQTLTLYFTLSRVFRQKVHAVCVRLHQASRRKCSPQVSHRSEAGKLLRRLKKSSFRSPISNWRVRLTM